MLYFICGCTGQRNRGQYKCKRNNLVFTDACQCGDNCDNPHNPQDSEPENSNGVKNEDEGENNNM